jgi:hypothetical protein
VRVHFYYESKREAPKILTARPAIGLLGYSAIIFRKELEYIPEKRETRKGKKTFLRRKSRLSIFRKVAEYNPRLKDQWTNS